MTTTSHPTRTEDRRLRDLSDDECWRLAATQPVGRMVWQGASGPCVVPVNFTMGCGGVQVRTAAYSALARECDDSLVAFEVDSFDSHDHTGWSVVMRGRAHLGYGQVSASDPEVWPEGQRALHVFISVEGISGRRVG